MGHQLDHSSSLTKWAQISLCTPFRRKALNNPRCRAGDFLNSFNCVRECADWSNCNVNVVS